MLKYCPYGPLVEYFPLHGSSGKLLGWDEDGWTGPHEVKPIKEAKPCKIFGHDCPVYYEAEKIVEYRSEEERLKQIAIEEL